MKNKKRNTWLWVLGWMFVFPLPLTILLLRNKGGNSKIKYGAIIGAWFVYALIVVVGGASKTKKDDSKDTQTVTKNKQKDTEDVTLSLLDKSEIRVKVGQESKSRSITIDRPMSSSFSVNEVQVVSEAPGIASVSYRGANYGTTVIFEIVGVSPGETYVYATSKDGAIVSERVKVIVPNPIEVSSITLSVKEECVLGETASVSVQVLPEDADDTSVAWIVDNDSVVTINQKGEIAAVGEGTATITATAKNGVSQSATVKVDSSRRVMSLTASYSRDDKNNIGNEWSHVFQVNGALAGRQFIVKNGETIEFYAKFTESDGDPDIGEVSKSYKVTDKDFNDGFTVTLDVYVEENGGSNRGKKAHFIVTYRFTIPQ